MPLPGALVDPYHEGGKGSISLIWVRQATRLATRCHNALRLSFTDEERDTRWPLDMAKACCTHVKIVNVGAMLCRMSRRILHLQMDQEHTFGGIAVSAALTLASWVVGRRKIWR